MKHIASFFKALNNVVSPLATNVSHREISQLICMANQLTDFSMRGTLIVKWLIIQLWRAQLLVEWYPNYWSWVIKF